MKKLKPNELDELKGKLTYYDLSEENETEEIYRALEFHKDIEPSTQSLFRVRYPEDYTEFRKLKFNHRRLYDTAIGSILRTNSIIASDFDGVDTNVLLIDVLISLLSYDFSDDFLSKNPVGSHYRELVFGRLSYLLDIPYEELWHLSKTKETEQREGFRGGYHYYYRDFLYTCDYGIFDRNENCYIPSPEEDDLD